MPTIRHSNPSVVPGLSRPASLLARTVLGVVIGLGGGATAWAQAGGGAGGGGGPEPTLRPFEFGATAVVRKTQRITWPLTRGTGLPGGGGGGVGQTVPFGPRGTICPGVAQSLAANFDTLDVGSEITLQAGMVQGEGFGQTYIVPDPNPATPENEAFPVEVNLIEVLTATVGSPSLAAPPITLGWTIEVYDGEPVAGNFPVFFVNSTDDQATNPDLPADITFERIPGSSGCQPCATTNLQASVTKLQFSVDPAADPSDRIIIAGNDAVNGVKTGRFTVVFKLRQMNDNTPYGACTFNIVNQCGPLNRCTNGFMATESNASGSLNSVTRNWAFFEACGPFACAGGTYRFSQLSAGGGLSGACRPSRDSLMQATYTPTVCTLTTAGACCSAATGACTISAQAACASGYQGNGTVCAPNPCPQPSAACCINGQCDLRAEAACTSAGGVFQGAGTTCAQANCVPGGGACCFGIDVCVLLEQAQCAGFGGTFQGASVTCVTSGPCPVGACCLPDGSCVFNRTAAECLTLFGGTFRGSGTTCASVSCPIPIGACCAGTGFCSLQTQTICGSIPGTNWRGAGTTCTPTNPCPQAGVCCRGTTCSTGVAQAGCSAPAGIGAAFSAGSPACNAAGNGISPCCFADFDKAGGKTVGDIFAYLSAWFAASPYATIGGNGTATPNVSDIFGFLSAWFAGC